MRGGGHIVTVTALLATSGCAILGIPNAELASNRRGPATLAPPLRVEWTYNAGAGFGEDGAVVVGDYVIVATRGGDVHAISVTTGKRTGMKHFGDALESAPLIQGNMMYVPVNLGRRALYGYDLERSIVTWRWAGAPIAAGLLPLEFGLVSVDANSTLRRFENQQVVWERSLDEDRFVHAGLLYAAGHIIVADDQGTVRGLDPHSGAMRWSKDIGAPVYTSMAAHAGRIFVPTTRGRLVALEAATGGHLWTFAHPDSSVRLATPAVDSTLVVFGGTDGTVWASEGTTGAIVWSFDAPDGVAAAPYLNAHVAYVGTLGSEIYALDRNSGGVRWQEKLRGRIKSNVAGYDDFLIVLSEPRYVYLLRSDDSVL